jgi:sugar phosphate isomerase/epimerase
MDVCVTHTSFDRMLTDLDSVMKEHKMLGCDTLGIGGMPDKYRQNAESINEFIKVTSEIGKKMHDNGLQFAYHNHAFEFKKVDGKCIMDYLIEGLDPEGAVFIVDTYWLQVGGKNPADFIKALGKRAMAIHFKDYDFDVAGWGGKQKMAYVGGGNLDWDAIIEACEEAGSRWALVEQDGDHIDGDPFKALALSYNYLTTKGFC